QSVTMMTPLGTSMIPTLNGMLFPLALAVGMNLLGALAGGFILYYVWRQGGKQLQIQKRLDALPPWTRRFAKTDLLSLIILRMLPWAGSNYATFLAGVSRVPLHIHMASIIIGALPGSLIYALLGAGIIAL
ncbi:MAG TPA: VTT domain-containing protein, partial [Candidatus Krumholzibacteria bacterium]|nr:VTT domain-containing protein [Candidatus Krumholzibacteria bacterium]